jgi:hypothetical protein
LIDQSDRIVFSGERDIMQLRTLIRHEEQILHESLRNNEDILANVEDLIRLLSDVVITEDKRAVSFYFLSSQVSNDLTLCLLSSLRRHETQSKLMKRQAIERACLAAYSLIQPDIEKFLGQDENGAKPVEKTLKSSFKYIQKEFPSHSHRLKQIKDMINSFYAHGNMFNSFRKEGNINFFDKRDPLIQRTLFWEIGYLACVIFDLWFQAAKQSVFVEQNEQRYIEYVKAVAISQKYREGFAIHERFAKWRLKV